MSTIPASLFVNVKPGVLAAGGSALVMNGVCLSTSTRVPIGTVQSFPDPDSVEEFFGPGREATDASVYFKGYDGATMQPAAMLFAQYPQSAVAAYLRGGPVGSSLTLAQLQALTGSLTVVMDGYSHVISSIALASYNSFSAAAIGISAAFTDPTEASFTAQIGATGLGTGSSTTLTMASVTGLISVGDSVGGDVGVPAGTNITALGTGTGGNGTYITNNPITSSGAPLTISSNVLDVTADTDHTISAGQTVAGSGVADGTLITGQLSGTDGGIGKYSISGAPQEVASEAMTSIATAPVVTYDSVSEAFVVTSGITGIGSTAAFATGTLAAPLLLTQATGAVLSQGAAAATPSAFMTALTQVTQNWASFFLAFDPDGGSGNAQKELFSTWTNSVAPRYVFAGWDTDITPTESVPASSSWGYFLQQGNLSGTNINYEPSNQSLAAFVSGAIASINFAQENGRVDFAFKGQTGLVAGVTTATAAVNLGGNPQVSTGDFGNGYNYYGAVATADQEFLFYQRATISGPWQWLDSYVNQIWFNNQLQLAILQFMTQVNSFPYNAAGYQLVENAILPVVLSFLNFGGCAAGVPLSASQIAAVNNAAGSNIAPTLSAQGYYIQIKPASPTVRQNRGSPPITIWYVDGESIQSISLASIDVQ
jgi:hypothetical protein